MFCLNLVARDDSKMIFMQIRQTKYGYKKSNFNISRYSTQSIFRSFRTVRSEQILFASHDIMLTIVILEVLDLTDFP